MNSLQLRWTGCKQVIVVCYKCRLTFYTDEFTVYCAAVVEPNHTKQSRKCFRNMKRIVSDKSEILCDNANCLLWKLIAVTATSSWVFIFREKVSLLFCTILSYRFLILWNTKNGQMRIKIVCFEMSLALMLRIRKITSMKIGTLLDKDFWPLPPPVEMKQKMI